MSIGDISYLTGRAHGIISKILSKSQISLLLSAKDLTELRATFTQTPYDKIIGDLSFETQISDVARSFKNSYADLLIKFYKQSSSSMQRKIQLFSERYNAENLRIILNGKYTDMQHEDVIARLIPVANYSLDYYKRLLSLSIQQIISEQREPILKKQLRRAFEEFNKTDRFTPLESAIDQYLYSILPKVSPHYEIYVNMKNILSLCRCLALNIPAYRYILPNQFIAKALKSNSVSEVLERYNYYPYSAVFSEYMGKKEIPLHTLEFAVERYLLKIWRKVFRFSTVFNSDSIIGFFEIKLAETMDVIRIIVGTNAGFSEQEIKESLLYYSVL